MTDLNPQDRALIDLARDGSNPTDADRKHVRAALVAQLGVGIGLTSTTAVGAATATAGAAVAGGAVAVGGGASASLVAAKVAAVVLLTGALSGGAFALHRTMRTGAAPMAASVGLVPPATGSNAPEGAPLAAVALPPLAPVPPSTVLAAPPPKAGASPRVESVIPPRSGAPTAPATSPLEGTPVAAPAPSMEPAAPLAPTTLDAETQLVRAGVAALHAGDPARALGIFDEHARLYPNGFLSEERAGERVLALCDLGRAGEAANAARAFLAEHSRSPLAARIRASCATPTNP